MNKLHEKLDVNLKRFSDETSVHGLKQLYYSKKPIWKCLWFIIMTLAIGITVYQVGKSVQQYRDQPTITTIQPLQDGKLLYPPLSFCYHHWSSWVDWQKVVSLNITKSVLLFGLSYLETIFSQDMFNVSNADQAFQKVMVENSWTQLKDFYFSIAKDLPSSVEHIYDYGINFTFFEKQFFSQYEFENLFCYTLNGDTLAAMTKLTLINVNVNQRKSDFIPIFFNIEKFPQTQPNNNLSTFEYAAYFKQSLPADSILMKTIESFDIHQRLNLPLLLLNQESDAIRLNSETDEYKITVKATMHRWQNRVKTPCYDGRVTNSADFSCETGCSLLTLSKQCRSPPFIVSYLLHLDTFQTICRHEILFIDQAELGNYTWKENRSLQCHCNFHFEEGDERDHCVKRCQGGCEKWYFDVSIQFWTDPLQLKQAVRHKYTKLEIEYPTEQSIFVITEEDSQTWETFIANVGGLLGIWLGASIVSFIQTIYLCCCCSETDDEHASNIFTPSSLKKIDE